jgi:hypothetical protein
LVTPSSRVHAQSYTCNPARQFAHACTTRARSGHVVSSSPSDGCLQVYRVLAWALAIDSLCPPCPPPLPPSLVTLCQGPARVKALAPLVSVFLPVSASLLRTTDIMIWHATPVHSRGLRVRVPSDQVESIRQVEPIRQHSSNQTGSQVPAGKHVTPPCAQAPCVCVGQHPDPWSTNKLSASHQRSLARCGCGDVCQQSLERTPV